MTEARDTRQGWARLTGLLYLLTNAAAAFAFAMRGQLTVRGDAIQTAANIAANEPLYRMTIAAELLTVVGTIALSVGLYAMLKSISRNLALLALCWRLAENSLLAAVTLFSLAALALLHAGPYATALDPAELEGLAYALQRVHDGGFQIGFLFLGLGSALFSGLWWKSRYIPRAIAGWGLLASLIMAGVALAAIVWPRTIAVVTLYYMAPMGLYEIGLGLWLLVIGIRIPNRTPA